MKVAALFSGGKDSVFSIYIAQQWGWDVKNLVTILPEKKDSWMFHSVNIDITDILAEALDIQLISKRSEGRKEEELSDLKELLSSLDIDGVISGAIASEYQRTRIEKICHDLDIKSFTPLWHKDQSLLLRDQIDAGFKILIAGVFAYGLDKSFLGKIIDNDIYNKLIAIKNKYSINTAGEGGEYETVVIDGPIFKKKLIVDDSSIEWRRDSGIFKILDSHLE
jgi:ABC transporter with metal-binding/Fe-S-binding domain ATP-binding protein